MNKSKNSIKLKKKTKIKKPVTGPVNNSTRNIILLILSIFFLAGITYAGTTISNSQAGYLVSDNVTINNTGAFYSGSKTFTRTADVVVCRGTSPADDLLKSFECDVVCKSTDDDCGTIIQNTFNSTSNDGGGKILLRKGIYPVNRTIFWKENIYLMGDGRDITEIRMSCGFPNDTMNYRYMFMTGDNESHASYKNNIGVMDLSMNGQSNCNLEDFNKYNLIHSFTDNYFLVSNVRFYNSTGQGLDCDGTPCNIIYSRGDHNHDGFYLNNADFFISNSEADYNDNIGIYSPQDGGSIYANSIHGNGQYGIAITSVSSESLRGKNKKIVGNTIYSNQAEGILLKGQGAYPVSNIIITGNTFKLSSTNYFGPIYGTINESNGVNNTITGNFFDVPMSPANESTLVYANVGNNYSQTNEKYLFRNGINSSASSFYGRVNFSNGLNSTSSNFIGQVNITSSGNDVSSLILKGTNNQANYVGLLEIIPQTNGMAAKFINTGANNFQGVNGFIYMGMNNAGDNGTLLKLEHKGTGAPIQIISNTTGKLCNNGTEGSIYYNGNTKKHYGCNSTDWNALY